METSKPRGDTHVCATELQTKHTSAATPVNGPDRFTPVSVCNTGGWRPLVFVITYHNEVVYHRVELEGKHEWRAKYGHVTPELGTFSFLFLSRPGVTYVTAVIQFNV